MKIFQIQENNATNPMHKEDPQQPQAVVDNNQISSKEHFLNEVPGPKKATSKCCRSCYDLISKNEGTKKDRKFNCAV